VRKSLFIILILLVLFPFSGPSYAERAWKPVLNKNGITVHSRPLPGSDIDELRARAVINARIEVLGEVLSDVDSHVLWMPDYKEARIIKMSDKDNMLIYVAMTTPFPVRDRDFIVRASAVRDYRNGVVTLHVKAVQDRLVPYRRGHVRIKKLTGIWKLRYIDREHTEVIYQLSVNPGGTIPLSVANYTNRSIPYRTIMGMIKMSKKPEYLRRAEKSPDRALVEKYLVKP